MFIYALKLLFPVLVILGIVTLAARSAFVSALLSVDEYRRAAIVLVAGTVVAFLGRDLAVLMLLIGAVAFWGGRFLGGGVRGKLAAFMLLVLIMPPVEYDIEGFGGINRFLEFTSTRVLSLVLLPGLAIRLFVAAKQPRPRWVVAVDWLVVGYQVLKLVLMAPQMTSTGLLRLFVGSMLDMLLPYYVFSRGIRQIADLRFVVSHLALACVFAAAVGCVECVVHRNLYEGLQWIYGFKWQLTLALMRGEHLRVQAMTGAPILFAFEMIIAIGIWTYLAGSAWRRPVVLAIFALMVGALVFTWSRGPWVGAMLFGLGLFGLRKLSSKAFGICLVGLVLGAIIVKSVGADTAVINALTNAFGAEGDELTTIDYRRQLLDTAIALVKQSPWLGVPNYAAQMQDLKQGEGIIDVVNSYVAIALDAGLVGLALYMAPYALVIFRMIGSAKTAGAPTKADGLGGYGFAAAFCALTIAALITIFTTSTFSVMPFLLTMLLALPVARLQMTAEGVTQTPQPRAPFDPNRISFGTR